MAKSTSSKLDWRGIPQSTPSASPTPAKGGGEFTKQELSYRGIADSTPSCGTDSQKITLKK